MAAPFDPVELQETVAAQLRRIVGGASDVATAPTAPTPGRTCSRTLRHGGTSRPAQTSWAMSEIMSGAASTPEDRRASSSGSKTKGESVAELTALADTMLAHAVRDRGPRRHPRHRRHRRRPVPHGEHLDDVRPRHRRSRADGRQARQPGGVVVRPVRPTCSRRSGSGSITRRRASAELAHEVGITFCFAHGSTPRSVTPPRAHRAGIGDGLQLPRAVHQPRPAEVRGDRRRRRPDGTARRRRARRRASAARSCSATRTVSTRSPRPVRPASGGPGRRRHRVGDRLGDRPRRRADHPRVAARGEGGLQRRRRAAAARRREPVPSARPSCSTWRPPSWPTAPWPAPPTARSSSAWPPGSGACACGAGQRRGRGRAGALAGCQRALRGQSPGTGRTAPPRLPAQSSSPSANACSRSCWEYVRNAM